MPQLITITKTSALPSGSGTCDASALSLGRLVGYSSLNANEFGILHPLGTTPECVAKAYQEDEHRLQGCIVHKGILQQQASSAYKICQICLGNVADFSRFQQNPTIPIQYVLIATSCLTASTYEIVSDCRQ